MCLTYFSPQSLIIIKGNPKDRSQSPVKTGSLILNYKHNSIFIFLIIE